MPLRLPLLIAMMTPRRRSHSGDAHGNGPGNGPRDRDPFGMDAEGRPISDRRWHARREDDLEPEQLQGFAFWAKLLFVHRAKLIVVLSGLSGIAGYLIATAGIIRRVTTLEVIAHANGERIGNLEQNDRIKTYMLCVLVKKADPIAAPPECGPTTTLPPVRN